MIWIKGCLSTTYRTIFYVLHSKCLLRLEFLRQRHPVVIRHILGKLRVVDIKLIVLITHKAPIQVMLGSIGLKRIELILDLTVDVLVLAPGFTALGFDYPDRAVLLHHDVVGIEKPLFLNAVHIDDGEILLSGITVLIHPFNIVPTLAVLLEQHFAGTAHKTGGKAGCILMIGVGQVFYLTLS